MNTTPNNAAAKAARINIVERAAAGVSKEHTVLEAAARHAVAQFFPATCKQVRVRIEVRKGMGRGMGDAAGWATAQKSRGTEYTIRLRQGAGITSMLDTVMHEMAHVQQRMTGRLVSRYCYDKRSTVDTWQGAELVRKEVPYRERPWEVEAFALSPELVRSFFGIIGAGVPNSWGGHVARLDARRAAAAFTAQLHSAPVAVAGTKGTKGTKAPHSSQLEERITELVRSAPGCECMAFIVRSLATGTVAASSVRSALRDMLRDGLLVAGEYANEVGLAA
jgi:hypothetical protein